MVGEGLPEGLQLGGRPHGVLRLQQVLPLLHKRLPVLLFLQHQAAQVLAAPRPLQPVQQMRDSSPVHPLASARDRGTKTRPERSNPRARTSVLPTEKMRKGETEKAEGDNELGTFVFLQQVGVIRDLLDFIDFRLMRDAGVFLQSKLEKDWRRPHG